MHSEAQCCWWFMNYIRLIDAWCATDGRRCVVIGDMCIDYNLNVAAHIRYILVALTADNCCLIVYSVSF